MDDKQLIWTVTGERQLLHTPVFDVAALSEVSAGGVRGEYFAVSAPDWVMVIAEYRGAFVLVRQWRHAARALSTEFPGGIADGGESPAEAAARELREETGFTAGRLTHLGSVSPNPALFSNRLHVYLAEELTPTGQQALDDDELLTYDLVPVSEVIRGYGEGDYTHALMGTALAFYLRHRYEREGASHENDR